MNFIFMNLFLKYEPNSINPLIFVLQLGQNIAAVLFSLEYTNG